MIESYWSSMERELLDRRSWSSREELASAIFEWIEGSHGTITQPELHGKPGQAPVDQVKGWFVRPMTPAHQHDEGRSVITREWAAIAAVISAAAALVKLFVT